MWKPLPLCTSVGRLTCVAGVLIGLHVAITVISHRFDYSTALTELPILTFVGLMLLAGLVYLIGVREISQNSKGHSDMHGELIVLGEKDESPDTDHGGGPLHARRARLETEAKKQESRSPVL